MRFYAGQYLEWMLPHRKPDGRGVRRYFTIASAPHEEVLRLVVRFAENGSTYKQALQKLKSGDRVIAGQRAGDFLLPDESETKLAFVAGGIGITPFLSHFWYMAHQAVPRDIPLFYCNNTGADIAYRDMFDDLADSGYCRVVHILAQEKRVGYEHGLLTKDIIEKHVPDYRERVWYLSGPPGMVYAYSTLLREMGVPRGSIVRDFFPGLV